MTEHINRFQTHHFSPGKGVVRCPLMVWMCILRQLEAPGNCPSAKTFLDLSACVTIGQSFAGFLFVCSDGSTLYLSLWMLLPQFSAVTVCGNLRVDLNRYNHESSPFSVFVFNQLHLIQRKWPIVVKEQPLPAGSSTHWNWQRVLQHVSYTFQII